MESTVSADTRWKPNSLLRICLKLCCAVFCVGAFITKHASAEGPSLGFELQEYFKQVTGEAKGDLRMSILANTLPDNRTIFAYNSTDTLTPASVQKLIVTALALKLLGGQYRFPTEVFVDHLPKELTDPNAAQVDFKEPLTSVGNLYVRGYGDPVLESSTIAEIADAVRRYGITEVENLMIDDTLFENPPRPTGGWAHEAGLSAVTVNFNCYSVYLAPGRIGEAATVSLTSGSPFQLTNHVMTVRGAAASDVEITLRPPSGSLLPGADSPTRNFDVVGEPPAVMVQGSVGHGTSGQVIYRSVPDIAGYFVSLLKYHLKQAGVVVRGKTLRAETPGQAKLLQTFESKELSSILQDQNHLSNNIIAGQLVYAIGQDSAGYFHYEKGLARMTAYLEHLGERPEDFELHDGSGLDRRNRLSAAQLVKVLSDVSQDFSIAPDFIASLSRFGHSGTLKSRALLEPAFENTLRGDELEEARRRAAAVWGKTGTLDGVSTLAGLLRTKTGEQVAFAILLGGVSDKDQAIRIEDGFVKILAGFPVNFVPAKVIPGKGVGQVPVPSETPEEAPREGGESPTGNLQPHADSGSIAGRAGPVGPR
ncbi:MAG: D-alanyl-D-alanine carboxypeptidase/D-alanyl-D-alanine-endopeptidase [Bdellovibrionota bacterium]